MINHCLCNYHHSSGLIDTLHAADELKAKINGFLDNKPEDLVAQIRNIYETYLRPSSPSYIPLDTHQVASIAKGKAYDRQTDTLALNTLNYHCQL